MIIVLILTLLWILAALGDGFLKGHYEDYLYFSNRNHKNLHPYYFAMRSILAISLGMVLWYACILNNNLPHIYIPELIPVIFIFALACIYPFFRDGMLYTTRNNLAPEVYKKRWWADKEKGEFDGKQAILEPKVKIRIIFACIGFVFITGIIFELNN